MYIIIAIIEKRMYKKANRVVENRVLVCVEEEEKSLTVPVYIFVFLIKIIDSRNDFSNPYIT